ncbi:MAG: hypothetical protein LBC53_06130 [Spirochaetaceae bacterium]|jgi:hypothetical protein|nr:hypothetical protein [Spirochaetaceae bacterium]
MRSILRFQAEVVRKLEVFEQLYLSIGDDFEKVNDLWKIKDKTITKINTQKNNNQNTTIFWSSSNGMVTDT